MCTSRSPQFIRLSLDVVTDELQAEYNINGATVSACFQSSLYYAYAAMQVPTGYLLDRFGPRRVFFFSCLFTCLGSLAFALSPWLWLATLGRLVCGIGTGTAWIGVLQVIGIEFGMDTQTADTLVGITNALGAVGGLISQAPFNVLNRAVGWRHAYLIVASVPAVLTVASLFVIQDSCPTTHEPGSVQTDDHTPLLAPREAADTPAKVTWGQVLRRPDYWLMLAFFCGFEMPLESITGLWGVPFLKQVHGFSSQTASTTTMCLVLVYAVCSLLAGRLMARVHGCRARVVMMIVSTLVLMVAVALVVAIPAGWPKWTVMFSMILAGTLGAGICVVWVVASSQQSTALTNGLMNSAGIGIAAVGQTCVGGILDALWDGKHQRDGARLYPQKAFSVAFAFLGVGCFVSLACSIVLFHRARRSA
eukprot:c11446_g1_i2.p1 GENE.c11446_g1_i2~~c11446_g1_i2.p1  ORF type:complete len:420 (-),score=53.06 c11446_g1_i2:98-1357(-)